jgi:hypothetical protein
VCGGGGTPTISRGLLICFILTAQTCSAGDVGQTPMAQSELGQALETFATHNPVPNEETKRVIELLKADPLFRSLDGQWQRRGRGDGRRLNLLIVAEMLWREVRRGTPADDALVQLKTVLEANELACAVTVMVNGVPPLQERELLATAKVLSFASLPREVQERFRPRPVFQFGPIGLMSLPPSALHSSYTLKPAFVPDPIKQYDDDDGAKWQNRIAELETIRRLFTLVGPSCLTSIAHVFAIESPVFRRVYIDHLPARQTAPLGQFDQKTAEAILAKYVALNHNVKEALRGAT